MAPWASDKQRRWGNSPAGKEALGPEGVKEWNDASRGKDLPEEAAQDGGSNPRLAKDIRRANRATDPNKGKRDRSGFHSPAKKQYKRNQKHRGQDQSNSETLTPIDETYRQMNFPIASLDWSTHKQQTFKDTGEKGLHPAWGMKSIIDRGVKPHEKSSGDKRIGEAENQTQKRDVPCKDFKAYSMVNAFHWVTGKDLPFPGAAAPFGAKDEDCEEEAEE